MTKIEKAILATIIVLAIVLIGSIYILNDKATKSLACHEYGVIHKVETNYIFTKEACYLDGKEIPINEI